MRKSTFLLLLSLFVLSCSKSDDGQVDPKPDESGKISIENISEFNSYYKNLDGTDPQVLKTDLHDLIDGNKVLPYSSSDFDVWDALELTDEDPDNSNNVILLYTGRSQAKSYKDQGQNDDNSWNREHVWAKVRGFGGDPRTVKGPSTDIHHIRPCDRSVNTDRYSKYFDNGGNSHSEAIECKYTSDTWEPRDAVKGDVARMMFYMAVRYEGDDGFKDLELNEIEAEDYTLPNIGKLSTLLKWHLDDPVDNFEKKRNQTIFDIQGNRNPFIDHPEFVDYIW
tara:strand:+ start:333 stop:1172 length:840 start_codon:yes stop_codon:yes gene_type:complete